MCEVARKLPSKRSFTVFVVTISIVVMFGMFKTATANASGQCQTFREADGTLTQVCYYRSGHGGTSNSGPRTSSKTGKTGQCSTFKEADGTITKVCYYRNSHEKPRIDFLNGKG
jgi:hypothetical protein